MQLINIVNSRTGVIGPNSPNELYVVTFRRPLATSSGDGVHFDIEGNDGIVPMYDFFFNHKGFGHMLSRLLKRKEARLLSPSRTRHLALSN
jgi:hypothetical protein